MMIGLTGKARCGKNTIADYLSEEYNTATFAFADALKKAAAEMFGIPVECFYLDGVKEKPCAPWGMSPREMLQKLGTECGRRVFGEDIWLKRLALQVEPWRNSDTCAGVVISDVRFENEAAWIRAQGGTIWHIQRDQADGAVRPHESEDGIQMHTGDWGIPNNGTIEALRQMVDRTFTAIIEGV